MKFPNKDFMVGESVLHYMNIILENLSNEEVEVLKLYNLVKQSIPNTTDFEDALDCLFLLNQISLDEKRGIIHVVRNSK